MKHVIKMTQKDTFHSEKRPKGKGKKSLEHKMDWKDPKKMGQKWTGLGSRKERQIEASEFKCQLLFCG